MSIAYETIDYRPKYRLTETHVERLWFVKYTGPPAESPKPGISIEYRDGKTILTLANGYEWDGASGPTFDSEDSQRASAVHDALYTLIEAGILPDSVRKPADKEFLRILREDGMGFLRRRAWYRVVRRFGDPHTA